MKIEVLPVKEPLSDPHIVAMIQGLLDTAFRDQIDRLNIEYVIAGEVYSYSLRKK